MASILRMSNVSKSLGEKQVLDCIDWEVNTGEHWVILGLNGSGKTTLLRIATGHLWPTLGEVDILGHRLGSMDLRVLRRKIGWVTSALTTRMSPSIKARDVVASGFFDSIGLYEEVPAKDLDKADSLVEFMGCEEVLTRAFGVLSQGEQQRILIARALMADPQLLVLDEPCIGLDMKSRESFLQSIGRITKVGPTVLYVTHHIEEIVPQFTHVLLLKGGKVFRSGQKRSILNSPNVSEAFGLEVKVEENDARYTLRILS